MKISFCTTCADKVGGTLRLGHLQQTLVQNLIDNPNENGVEVEFVVLNYGDKGGLHEWMTTDTFIVEQIEAGRITYARTPQPLFRMAHAKNMAHRIARGDVVCNVDADNFTGPKFARALAKVFEGQMDSIVNPSHLVSKKFDSEERGFFGRVALSRYHFLKLGGYDEAYSGWGGEDTNLTQRARLLGMTLKRFEEEEFLSVLTHDNRTRVEGMFKTVEEREAELRRIFKHKNDTGVPKLIRAFTSRMYALCGPLAANSGTHFGLGKIDFRGLKEVDEEIKPLSGRLVSAFDSVSRIKNVGNLARGRLAPEIISLRCQGDGPS